MTIYLKYILSTLVALSLLNHSALYAMEPFDRLPPKTKQITEITQPTPTPAISVNSEHRRYLFRKDTPAEALTRPNSAKHLIDNSDVATPYIVGGAPVSPGERGYQVSLQNIDGHYCGGALISRDWVLTAAHCINENLISVGFDVLLGTNDLESSEAILIRAAEVKVHELYNSAGVEFDVALVRLATPAPANLPLLKLATEEIMNAAVNVGNLVTVSGWGFLNNNQELSPLLQQVSVPIADRATCSASYMDAVNTEVTDTMLCAGLPEGGQDSCFGDSGGPLTVTSDGEDYSVGIVSWGYSECATPEHPGVYTRTASYLTWIEQTMQSEPITITQVPHANPSVNAFATTGANYYAFELPNTAQNFEVTLDDATGTANLAIYTVAYPVTQFKTCEKAGNETSKTCQFPLAYPGIYTIEVTSNNGENITFDLNFGYDEIDLTQDFELNDIAIPKGVVIPLEFTLTEPGQSFNVSLSGGTGDADLYVFNTSTETDAWSCFSTAFENDESCILEDAPVGTYSIYIVAYAAVEGLSFKFDITRETDEIEEPPLPPAICQHTIITQLGKYYIASIDIFNISDQFLTDWYVTWDYSSETRIQAIQNGIITARSPYRAESPEVGRAIAPMTSTTLYLIVRSATGVAENPPVSGNYCY